VAEALALRLRLSHRARKRDRAPWLGRGAVVLYLSAIVLLPLAAVLSKSLEGGLAGFWDAVSSAESVAALKLTVIASLIVVAINGVFGTVVAWVLVRDEFPGKRVLNAFIDLPFALPTIVAGITLMTLYGPDSPIGVDVTFTKAAVVLALLFVTLPFVVRAVQPLLMEMDREMEEAAASLGAGNLTIFRRIVFPNLLPGIGAGVALAFAGPGRPRRAAPARPPAGRRRRRRRPRRCPIRSAGR